jgi:hypothetical protein
MRYLYGDSSVFPHKFNFLSTLESFVTCGVRVVQLESEARSLQIGTASAAAVRIKAIEDLERFHQVIVQAVQESTTKSMSAQTTEYSKQVVDFAARLVEDNKRAVVSSNDRDQASVRAEVARRRSDIRSALETFLVAGRLPTLEAIITMEFDGQCNFSSVVTSPEGIMTSFKLAPTRLPAWHSPRKVSDFAQSVNLMVGLKKSLFRRAVEPELINVDDYLITGFDLSDESADIHLRKKLQERDVLVFKMTRESGELRAEVSHPSEEGGADLATTVEVGDRLHLDRLWQGLRAAADEVLDHKEGLISLLLDGEDVFENDLAIMFIERLIKYMAPTVSEISKRSPNPMEYSLKVESDAGRREEIYVKKEDLLAKLMSLGEKERAVFAGFGLVPSSANSMPDLGDVKFDDEDL